VTNADTPAGRIRIAYSKTGKIRFTSHRDLARIWERALRRAEVPVSYSQGFSPRPRLSFGLALPTSFESAAEYLDVDVDADFEDPAEVADAAALSRCLPVGMDTIAVWEIPRSSMSLQEAVNSCTWFVEIDAASSEVPTGPGDMDGLRTEILDADTIEITRKRKGRDVIDDVRPMVGDIVAGEPGETGPTLVTELGTKPRALRPTDLLAGVRPGLVVRRVRRLHQWINVDGERVEPLDSAPVAARGQTHAPQTTREELCAT
jgi:radical SAM-linked protein